MPAPVGIWPVVSSLLKPALERGGDSSLDEVMAEVDEGRAQLWIAHRAEDVRMALVTQAAGDALHLWLCGGREMPSWLGFLDTLKAAAREGGFKRLTIDGRRGWGRVLGWAKGPDGCWECAL